MISSNISRFLPSRLFFDFPQASMVIFLISIYVCLVFMSCTRASSGRTCFQHTKCIVWAHMYIKHDRNIIKIMEEGKKSRLQIGNSFFWVSFEGKPVAGLFDVPKECSQIVVAASFSSSSSIALNQNKKWLSERKKKFNILSRPEMVSEHPWIRVCYAYRYISSRHRCSFQSLWKK